MWPLYLNFHVCMFICVHVYESVCVHRQTQVEGRRQHQEKGWQQTHEFPSLWFCSFPSIDVIYSVLEQNWTEGCVSSPESWALINPALILVLEPGSLSSDTRRLASPEWILSGDILGCLSSCLGLRKAVLAQGDQRELNGVRAFWDKAIS